MIKVDPGTWRSEGAEVGIECTPFAPEGDVQRSINLRLMEMAETHRLPLLLSLDSHMVTPDKKFLQDILLMNGNQDGWRFTRTYYQMNTAEAWTQWVNVMKMGEYRKEFIEAVDNNKVLTEMVSEISLPFGVRLPWIQVPEKLQKKFPEDETAQRVSMLIRRIHEHGRLPDSRVYRDRVSAELEVIAYNGEVDFTPYFLFIEDLCREARECGELPGPGRGSAAGCLISYLLKITHIDPIKWDLSFARFLSNARIHRKKFPDIDLDFGNPEVLIERMKSRMGDRFVRICTVGTIKERSAIRDVARALIDTKHDNRTRDETDAAAKSLSFAVAGQDPKKWLFGYTDEDGMEHEGEIDRNTTLQSFFSKYPDVQEGVMEVLDIPKSIGRHAAAFCVADGPIGDLVPICFVGGEECTQYTKDPIEKVGLVKMDILGLNTLNDIRGAITWIAALRGKEIDFYDLPLDDEKTWTAFKEGRNETVFQFSKGTGVNLSRRAQPNSVDDLAQMTSAGRPGTMDALMPDGETLLIDQWIGVRANERVPEYIHPSVEHILRETGGVCLFQEQISAMFQVACGYTEEEADEIREIVGKKQADKMKALVPEISRKLEQGGWTEIQIESFISLCNAAAGYSFNKSHAVSYAYLGFACQYLKENFPLEWWASVLQNSKKEDLRANSQYCAKFISAPDVNLSEVDVFIADKRGRSNLGRIVFPLRMLHGVGTSASCIAETKPYSSLADFYERIDRKKVNRGVVARLIWSGAFDSLCGVQKINQRNQVYSKYLKLYGGPEKDTFVPKTELELMKAQGEAFPVIEPDYASYAVKATGRPISCASAVGRGSPGRRIKVAGIIRDIHKLQTKKGDDMAFITIANLDASASITLFPEAYQTHIDILKEGEVVVVMGQVNEFNSRRSLIANEIKLVE